jgi:hypothetical protein
MNGKSLGGCAARERRIPAGHQLGIKAAFTKAAQRQQDLQLPTAPVWARIEMQNFHKQHSVS